MYVLMQSRSHLNEVLNIRAQECRTPPHAQRSGSDLNEVLNIRAQESDGACLTTTNNSTSMKS